jgi:pimeloyl-ACP methyl ester carboxylesterase
MTAIELASAVAKGDAKRVRSVLASAEDVKQLLGTRIGLNNATILHMAVSHGHIDVVDKLLEFGADPNALDVDLVPPIGYIKGDTPNADATRAALVARGGVEDPEYFKFNASTPGDEEQAGYIDRQFLTKCFVTFLIPFAVLVLYNGVVFCVAFVTVTTAFYFVAVGYFVSEITVKPPWYHPTPGNSTLTTVKLPSEWRTNVHNPRKNLGLEYEDVTFGSSGGYTLRGWLVPGKKDNARLSALIFCHGGGRDRRSWLRHLPLFHEAGYTCLLFDFREHGLSEGARRGLTFGMYERFDVLAAAQFMKQIRGFSHVAVVGTSMGASSAIMAAGIDDSRNRFIDLVVAENPLLTCAHLQRQHIHNIISPYFKHSIWGRTVYWVFQRMASVWLNIRVGNKPSRHAQSMHCVAKRTTQ